MSIIWPEVMPNKVGSSSIDLAVVAELGSFQLLSTMHCAISNTLTFSQYLSHPPWQQDTRI